MSPVQAGSLTLCISFAYSFPVTTWPNGVLNILFDDIPVGMSGYFILPQLDIVPKSTTSFYFILFQFLC